MKLEVLVPDSLSDITLGQYQKYLSIQENNEDENFLAVKMIEIFCGLRGDLIMKMKAKIIRDITTILAEMFNEKPQLIKEFKLNGKTYGFIPKLEDMSFGEYIDLDTYIGDMENIHRAMNVLYRPVKQKYQHKYLIEEYTGNDPDKMKEMPMDAVLSSILFFYHLGMDLSQAMMNSLQEQEITLVQQQLLEESGGGINQFSDSLKEILEDLRISLN